MLSSWTAHCCKCWAHVTLLCLFTQHMPSPRPRTLGPHSHSPMLLPTCQPPHPTNNPLVQMQTRARWRCEMRCRPRQSSCAALATTRQVGTFGVELGAPFGACRVHRCLHAVPTVSSVRQAGCLGLCNHLSWALHAQPRLHGAQSGSAAARPCCISAWLHGHAWWDLRRAPCPQTARAPCSGGGIQSGRGQDCGGGSQDGPLLLADQVGGAVRSS